MVLRGPQIAQGLGQCLLHIKHIFLPVNYFPSFKKARIGCEVIEQGIGHLPSLQLTQVQSLAFIAPDAHQTSSMGAEPKVRPDHSQV